MIKKDTDKETVLKRKQSSYRGMWGMSGSSCGSNRNNNNEVKHGEECIQQQRQQTRNDEGVN